MKLGDDTPIENKAKRQAIIPVKPVNIFSQLKTDKVVKPSPIQKGIQQPQAVIEPAVTHGSSTATASNNGQSDASEAQGLPETTIHTIDSVPEVKIPAPEMAPPEKDQQGALPENFEPLDDREIEDRILEFEAQLGLKCPLCGTGNIKTSETAKGKTYYHCSSSGCNFISWGKPYFIDCPKCASNFLIEVTDSSGKTFLKCPKATCTHWQKFPWEMSGPDTAEAGSVPDSPGDTSSPKKLVRRRRVVRRKR